MDALVDLSWRAYPGGAIMAAGVAMLIWGLAGVARGERLPFIDRTKPIVWVSGLRMVLVGMAIAAFGGAWIWQQLWLLILALVIGGEELVETSIVLFVLRWGQRQEAQPTLTA